MIKIGDKVKIKFSFIKGDDLEPNLKKIFTVKKIMYNRFLKSDVIYLEGFFHMIFTRKDLTKVNCLELE